MINHIDVNKSRFKITYKAFNRNSDRAGILYPAITRHLDLKAYTYLLPKKKIEKLIARYLDKLCQEAYKNNTANETGKLDEKEFLKELTNKLKSL